MPSELIPEGFRDAIIPKPFDPMEYHCLSCGGTYDTGEPRYTCESCGGLLLLRHQDEALLKAKGGDYWRKLFAYRRLSNHESVRGVFSYQEFLAPSIGAADISYLGEGHTPLVSAPPSLAKEVGMPFRVKLDGLNPSLSFKDRGMAVALSYVKWLVREKGKKDLTVVCASTGDTSAAAALYAASLGDTVRSAVLVPQAFVTQGQLFQPIIAGARVYSLPGVFDDCMQVVASLSEDYPVLLLNSKNPWRILGQESLAYELAEEHDWDLSGTALFVPVGNAGNTSAILSGLLKLLRAGVIEALPKFIATQSVRANPVALYYAQPKGSRGYAPVKVRQSVAQAAMIGDPVSFPRLSMLADDYEKSGGFFTAIDVEEQDIMDNMMLANGKGLVVCTQGGEALAGLRKAMRLGIIAKDDKPVLDSTAHPLKFKEFALDYTDDLLKDYDIRPVKEYRNFQNFVDPASFRISQEAQKAPNGAQPIDYKGVAGALASHLGLPPGKEATSKGKGTGLNGPLVGNPGPSGK
ncbi:MAG: threonine synthase [Deltaproteobacteria bacterium]|jgi:threonine synthase|nr:threonine synthase [Deltaproteobacteria bacterium]